MVAIPAFEVLGSTYVGVWPRLSKSCGSVHDRPGVAFVIDHTLFLPSAIAVCLWFCGLRWVFLREYFVVMHQDNALYIFAADV